MARLPRLVVPGQPMHIIHRGNNRQVVFFGEDDYRRFKSGMIDSDRYLLTCYRYIEMNPVRAGMTDSPEGYRWSSFHFNALGHLDRVVVPHEEYLALGEENEARRRAYVALFDHELSGRELAAIREGTEKGEAIRSEQFQEEMARRVQRRVTRLRHGGDRKSKAYRGME